MPLTERQKLWNKENPEKVSAYKKAYRERNKEVLLQKQREHREQNREQHNAYFRDYYEKNKEIRIPYLNAHRKGRLRTATPAWADLPAIRQFYVNCPKGYHVDHVLPLRGKEVSGLHVLGNLQYLPATENLKKGNKVAIYEEGPKNWEVCA